MKITHSQAIDAVQIIAGLVEQAGGTGWRVGAVELQLAPPVVEEMRTLIRKIEANE